MHRPIVTLKRNLWPLDKAKKLVLHCISSPVTRRCATLQCSPNVAEFYAFFDPVSFTVFFLPFCELFCFANHPIAFQAFLIFCFCCVNAVELLFLLRK